MRTGPIIAVALGFLCGTNASLGVDSWPRQRAGATSAVFRPLYEGVLTDEEANRLRAALPCESISLERSGGMVAEVSAAFTVTFRKNGDAELSGSGFGRSGDFVGNVDLFDFGKLCHLLHDVGFERMQPRYARRVSDLQTQTVSATMARGARTVVDYGGAGPIELWSVQRAIEALAWKTNWEER